MLSFYSLLPNLVVLGCSARKTFFGNGRLLAWQRGRIVETWNLQKHPLLDCTTPGLSGDRIKLKLVGNGLLNKKDGGESTL